mgnify:CR=1 FL=1
MEELGFCTVARSLKSVGKKDLKHKKLLSAQNGTSRHQGCVYSGDLNQSCPVQQHHGHSRVKAKSSKKSPLFQLRNKTTPRCWMHQYTYLQVVIERTRMLNNLWAKRSWWQVVKSGKGIFPVVVIKVNGITCWVAQQIITTNTERYARLSTKLKKANFCLLIIHNMANWQRISHI